MSDEVETAARGDLIETESPNAGQSEYWNGTGGSLWTAAQTSYDAQLRVFAALVADASDPKPSDRVLDIGCGTGALTRMVAKKATEGSVYGLDISQAMVDKATELTTAAGLTNVEFGRVDVQENALPDELDHIVSRFGVMFFDDPLKAFTNIASALSPRGMLTFVAWRAPEDNEWLQMPGRAVSRVLGPAPEVDTSLPGPFSLSDGAQTADLLAASGLGVLGISQVDANLYLGGPGTVEDTVRFCMETTRMAMSIEEQPEAKPEVSRVLTEALTPYHDGTGVQFSSSVWLVTAERI